MDDHLGTYYDADLLLWTSKQVELLRAKKFDLLDLENLIEELEGYMRKEKREVDSRLRVLQKHLLKYKYQPQRISSSWISIINEQRSEIESALSDMPSLRRSVEGYVAKSYPKAVRETIRETRLPPSTFPKHNPFSVQQILDEDYWPGENDKAADT
jgi:sugar-specific transcriptional regulator TrmB